MQLLTEQEHQRFLELRLSIAESRADHSFHCQTPNCRGWCVYEDEVNEFHCELCDETNCILCRVAMLHIITLTEEGLLFVRGDSRSTEP